MKAKGSCLTTVQILIACVQVLFSHSICWCVNTTFNNWKLKWLLELLYIWPTTTIKMILDESSISSSFVFVNYSLWVCEHLCKEGASVHSAPNASPLSIIAKALSFELQRRNENRTLARGACRRMNSIPPCSPGGLDGMWTRQKPNPAGSALVSFKTVRELLNGTGPQRRGTRREERRRWGAEGCKPSPQREKKHLEKLPGVYI